MDARSTNPRHLTEPTLYLSVALVLFCWGLSLVLRPSSGPVVSILGRLALLALALLAATRVRAGSRNTSAAKAPPPAVRRRRLLITLLSPLLITSLYAWYIRRPPRPDELGVICAGSLMLVGSLQLFQMRRRPHHLAIAGCAAAATILFVLGTRPAILLIAGAPALALIGLIVRVRERHAD